MAQYGAEVAVGMRGASCEQGWADYLRGQRVCRRREDLPVCSETPGGQT